MARDRDTYSRTVGALKIALPVTALVILSTVFLVSKRVSLDQPPPFDALRLEELLSGEHITSPSFATMTEDGSAVLFAADRAQPRDEQSGSYIAEMVRADIATPDGGRMTMDAPTAMLDQETNELEMTDGVVILTSTGYRITADRFVAKLDETGVVSAGAVVANGPVGTITAGQMEMLESGDGYVVVFKDRLKLVYDPSDKEDDSP